MTEEEKDKKEFEECWKKNAGVFERHERDKFIARFYWHASRRTLREQIKADPSIGKLLVDGEWPESPDY